MRFRALLFVAAVVSTATLSSCSENLEGGGSCPLLCPQEAAPIKDTTIDAITLDTSIAGFPPIGFEQDLVLAKRGDTLDTRVIVRYDSLPTTYKFSTDDSLIVRIDSAYIKGFVVRGDTGLAFQDSGAIEVYDVTDADVDTAVASLMAQFTPQNRIGTYPFNKGDSPDSLTIQLDKNRVYERIVNGQSLRLGFRMATSTSEQIRFRSQQTSDGWTLFLHPNLNPSLAVPTFDPRSVTPKGLPHVSASLGDFVITAVAPVPATVLRVGGYPARRILFRFKIPPEIVDSSVVIRATLMLTQRPATSSSQSGDTVKIHLVPIVASNLLTDLHELLEFAGSPAQYRLDSLVTTPKDSATRELQMVTLVRSWSRQDTVRTPRVVAVYMGSESEKSSAVDFHSMEAAAGLRPRLRLTYITRLSTGRP